MTQQKKNFNLKVGDKIDYKVIKYGYKTVNGTINVTEDLDNLTQITLDPSSEIYNSNLDYTISTEDLCPPIITFNNDITLPDGYVMKKNSYMYAPYGQSYLLPKYSDGEENITRVGNIKINSNKIASNFSSNDYIKTIVPFNPSNNLWEVKIKFKTGSDFSDDQSLFHSSPADVRYGVGLWINKTSGTFNYFCSTDGNNWLFDLVGTFTCNLNTIYWVKIGWTGTEYYLDVSEDDITYIRDITYASEIPLFNALISTYFGIYYRNGMEYPWKGTIDFSDSYIKVNNNIIWELNCSSLSKMYFTQGSIQVTNGIANNFYNNNLWYLKWMSSDTFEFITKANTGLLHDNSYLLYDVTKGTAVILLDSSSRVCSYINSSWVYNNYTVESNKNYWFRLNVVNRQINCYVKEAGEEENCPEINNMDLAFSVKNNQTFIGHQFTVSYNNNSNEYWKGTIDLNKTIFITDNTTWKIKSLYELNYETVYNPLLITDDHIVSGFNYNTYIKLNNIFNPGNKTWEMQFKFKQDQVDSNWRALFGSTSNDYTSGAHFYVTGTGGISVELGQGNNWGITGTGGFHAGNLFTSNEWCWARLEFTGSSYNVWFSKDGINFNKVSYKESTTTINATQPQAIGCDEYTRSNSHSFNGSIDLNETWIKIDGEYWWKPVNLVAKTIPGILDTGYIDTGDEVTLNLYDIQTDKRNLILNTNTNHNVNNLKFQEYIDQITIPEHGLSIYENDMWSKRREVTLTVDDENVDIYTEGNV